MDALFEIQVVPVAKGARDAARLVHGQLRAAIVDGRLVPGARLPATRAAAARFGVSRSTAVEAYERLAREGLVIGRRGSGTYVAEARAAKSPAAASWPPPEADRRLNPFWLRDDVAASMYFWQDPAEPSPAGRGGREIDLRPALVDSRLFPLETFRRNNVSQLRGLERHPPGLRSAQGNPGSLALREAVTAHLGVTRAVACASDDVVITAGAQQAFDLLARVLVRPRETVVAVEDPGYPPMRVAFAAAGARVVPVPVDGEGLMVERLPADAGVICVCPSHQFPLGMAMSARRRQALMDFARAHGAVIVEDDYDGEFRLDGEPLGALRAAGTSDAVFYVGTFSKCMLPALRLGFIVAPAWATRTLVLAKNCLDWHCPSLVQRAVAGFITGGHLTRHVRRMRRCYQERRSVLLDLLQTRLGEWLVPVPSSSYGMHLAAVGRQPRDLDAVAGDLLRRRVKLHTLTRYHAGESTHRGFVFGYGAAAPADLSRGVALLRQAVESREVV